MHEGLKRHSYSSFHVQAVRDATTICPIPRDLDLRPFKFESGVRVRCDVDYLCANFSLPRPICSRLRPGIRDRQTSDRQTDVRQHHRLMPPPRGRGITMLISRNLQSQSCDIKEQNIQDKSRVWGSSFLYSFRLFSLSFINLLDYREYNKSSNGMTISSKTAKTKNNKITTTKKLKNNLH